jgi:hypothetical protein
MWQVARRRAVVIRIVVRTRPVKDRYWDKCASKSNNSSRRKTNKNAASNGALRRIEKTSEVLLQIGRS